MDTAWPRNWPAQAEELHLFDPKGDVLLLLNRRLPREETEAGTDEDEAPAEEEEDAVEEEEDAVEEEEDAVEEEEAAAEEEEDAAEEEEAAAEEEEAAAEDEEAAAEEAAPEEAAPEAIESGQELEPIIKQVQMRVSSKHLILTSQTFCTSLNSFYAGHVLRTEGNAILSFPDEDPDVMIILLHIIHVQNRKVPRQVSLDMLTKLAAAVNYHHLQEATELFADIWIKNLEEDNLPTSYKPEAFPWLLIFWAFRVKVRFREITQILQRECDENLEDEANAVPEIPASIISSIQSKRIVGIETLIQVIHGLIAKYSRVDTICRNNESACDALVLGTIIRHSVAIGIWPKPNYPYPGLIYKPLAEKIVEIHFPPAGKSYYGVCTSYKYNHTDRHGISNIIKASVESLENSMCGLELEDFLPTQEKERLF